MSEAPQAEPVKSDAPQALDTALSDAPHAPATSLSEAPHALDVKASEAPHAEDARIALLFDQDAKLESAMMNLLSAGWPACHVGDPFAR